MKKSKRSRYFINYTYHNEAVEEQVYGSFFTTADRFKINSSDIRNLEEEMTEEYGYPVLITSYQKMF